MCKKQTSVSHSSTEAEVISLDAGLRMDGIPARSFGFGDWNISFFTKPTQQHQRCKRATEKLVGNSSVKNGSIRIWPTLTTFHQAEHILVPMLCFYVVADNEVVIKMIIKGRSPTMRHVSRTHRTALNWLFDRINSDPKIQIRYIDTKNQLADILSKGNFTRDEWNNLLHCSMSAISAPLAALRISVW